MLSTSGKRPNPLTQADLRKLVEEALLSSAYTYEEAMIETIHAKFDHVERKLDVNDVLHGLRKVWQSSSTHKFNQYFWQWHYAIKTEDVEGLPLTIVIAVDTRNRTFEVVTRW
jgi:hypothetical protein